jgi:hypothetical protein
MSPISIITTDNNSNHHKIKCLVEVDDGIFTVFIAWSSQFRGIWIAITQISTSKIQFPFMCQAWILIIKIIEKTGKRCCCRCGFKVHWVCFSVRSRPGGIGTIFGSNVGLVASG